MIEQLFLTDLILTPEPSFDNFMVASTNQEPLAALKNIRAGQAIYLWGESGAGKSHLLIALRQHHSNCQYYTAETFPHETHLLQEILPQQLILLDDVQLLSTEQQTVLFNLYNHWHAHKLTEQAFTLVVSSNQPPMHMQIREDLRNRLGWGVVYHIDSLNDDEGKQALEQRAQEKGLQLSKEVLQWIFTYCPRDMRTIFGLLEALDAYSLSQKRPITIPLLKNLIQSKELFQ